MNSHCFPLSKQVFNASKEAKILTNSNDQNIQCANSSSHIGSLLKKRSASKAKLCKNSKTQAQQQQKQPTTGIKSLTKQLKLSKISNKHGSTSYHHIIIIESDHNDSIHVTEDESNVREAHFDRNSALSSAKIHQLPSPGRSTEASEHSSSDKNIFGLEYMQSGSTVAMEREEDFFTDFEECEPTLKKLIVSNKCHEDLVFRAGCRKDSLLSNCSDTITPMSSEQSENLSSSDNLLTPLLGSTHSYMYHHPSSFSLEAKMSYHSDFNEDGCQNAIPNRILSTNPSQEAVGRGVNEGSECHSQLNERRFNVARELETAKMLIEQRMGRLAAEVDQYDFPCCTLSIRCFHKHSFSLQPSDVLRGAWCVKCEEQLQRASEFAHINDGQLLSDVFSKTLKFKCAKDHVWECSHASYQQRWCIQCHQIAKDSFKQFIREEEEKKQAEYEKNQEEIYREARRRALEHSSSLSQENQADYCNRIISAAKQVESEVEKIANTQAKSFYNSEKVNDEFDAKSRYEDAKEVLKVLLFPDQIMSVYLLNLSSQVLNQYYRAIAKVVHPDKNRHPRAAEAFQKLHRFYSAAVNKNQQQGFSNN